MIKLFGSVLIILMGGTALAYYQEEFISAPGQFPANHSSTMVEVSNQSYLACWYAGSKEGASDVQIYCRRWMADLGSWGETVVAVQRGEKASGAIMKNDTVANPVLYRQSTGRVWLIYGIRQFGGWLMSHIDYKFSDDDGRSWSSSYRLVSRFGHLSRTKPMAVNSTTFLLPLYQEFPKRGYVATVKIKNDQLQILETKFIPGKEHLQPSLVSWRDQLFAFLRNNKKGHVLMSSWDFQKMVWRTPSEVLDLPNPNSSVDALARSENEILIVYNANSEERAPLSLALSKDGRTFRHLFDFEPFGINREYSYPSLMRSSDGRYHLTYTYDYRSAIKHVTFDEAWIDQL